MKRLFVVLAALLLFTSCTLAEGPRRNFEIFYAADEPAAPTPTPVPDGVGTGPVSIDKVAYWGRYDYDTSNLWEQLARSTNPTANNDKTAVIDDISGNGAHFVTPTDGQALDYVLAAGFQGFFTDGSNTEILKPETNPTEFFNQRGSDPFSLWFVFETRATIQPLDLVTKRASTITGPGWSLRTGAGNKFIFIMEDTGGGKLEIASSTTLATFTRYAVSVSTDGTRSAAGMSLYINGVSDSFTTTTDTLTDFIQNTEPTNIIGIGDTSNNGSGGLYYIETGFTTDELTSLEHADSYTEYLAPKYFTEDPTAAYDILSGIFTDTGKTDPVDQPGIDEIGAWEDRIGGVDFSQAANKPLYDETNGSPIGTLVSASSEVFVANSTSAFGFAKTSPFSVIWFSDNQSGDGKGIWGKMQGSGSTQKGYSAIVLSGTSKLRFTLGGGASDFFAVDSVDVYNTGPSVYAITYDGVPNVAASVNMYRNGSSISTASVVNGLSGTITNSTAFSYGEDGPTQNQHFDGDLGSLYIYDRELTAAEVGNASQVLMDLYGIP